ncbi:MAG: IgGFc-binding protein, partial [Sphingobacteriaceae bacterium]|nr:IgGFc-binding protein [Sphingobacteriaceae bacterium]
MRKKVVFRRHHITPLLTGLFWFLSFCTHQVSAQTDTTFWFAVPEVASSHADRPIFLRFTSQGLAAQVTISQPATPSFTPIQVQVAANGVSSINLSTFIDELENLTPNVVAQKGLLISSTAPITAYYEVNATNNPDIFSLKGKTALGTSFMIPGQNFMSNGNGKNAFDIVATENNTTITIKPTKALEGGRAANVAFTVILNKGETFSCRAAGTGIGDKLTGTTVSANKPIAITLIDDSVRGGEIYSGSCRDLLGDQLIPIAALGLEFIVQRGFLNVDTSANRSERVIVMAVENNTHIYIDGSSTAVATLNAGETYERRMGSNTPVTHLLASKIVYVIHISGFGCETGMAVIPAISCTGSSLVGFRRSTAEQFGITVTTRTVHKNAFSLNNVAINLNFNIVPGTNGEWSYARIFRGANDTSDFNLSTGYILTNTSGNFHLGIINGGNSSGCRYGYFSGFAQVNIKATSNSTVEAPACQSSAVFLQVDSIFKATYSWTGPNGFNSSARVINFPQVTFADTGLYTVTATVDNCISRIDSINIVIKPRPNEALATNDGPDYCHGSTIRLFAATIPGVAYHWIGPNGFSSNNQNPVITQADFVNGGTYRLITELDGCSSDTTFTEIYVFPRPVITPLSAVEFCRYDSVTLITGGGVNYQWYKNNTLISGVNDSFYVVWEEGDYYAVVTNEFGCKDTADAIEVTVFPLPDKQLGIAGDTTFCVGDSARLFTAGGYQYTWLRNGQVLSGQTDSFLVVRVDGTYKVVVMNSDSCVDSSQSVQITVFSTPIADLSASSDSLCTGETGILTATGGTRYAWLHQDTLVTGADSAVLLVQTAGSYRVIAYNAAGCSDTSSAIFIILQPVPNAAIDSSGPLHFCAGDSVVLASTSSATGYVWLKDGLTFSSDSSVSVSAAGNYQLVLTNAFGCVDSSAVVSVVVNPLPVATIDSSGSLHFCAGDSVVLASTSSATAYVWLKDGVSISSDSSVSVSAAGNYQLVLTNAFGCVDSSAVVSVVVNPLPVATIDSSGSLHFCAGDSVVLASTSSATAYVWLKDGVSIS